MKEVPLYFGHCCGTKVVRPRGPHPLLVSQVPPAPLSPLCILPSAVFNTIPSAYHSSSYIFFLLPFKSYPLPFQCSFKAHYPSWWDGLTLAPLQIEVKSNSLLLYQFSFQSANFLPLKRSYSFPPLCNPLPKQKIDKRVDNVVWVGWWSVEPPTTAPPSTSRSSILKSPHYLPPST